MPGNRYPFLQERATCLMPEYLGTVTE